MIAVLLNELRGRDPAVSAFFADVRIESVLVRIGLLEEHVPFAEEACIVARLPENPAHADELIGVDFFTRIRLDSGFVKIVPGEHGCSRRNTQRIGAICPRKPHAADR